MIGRSGDSSMAFNVGVQAGDIVKYVNGIEDNGSSDQDPRDLFVRNGEYSAELSPVTGQFKNGSFQAALGDIGMEKYLRENGEQYEYIVRMGKYADFAVQRPGSNWSHDRIRLSENEHGPEPLGEQKLRSMTTLFKENDD